ncbi:MAG: M28 family peptidase [Candidatus Hydrogenedentes bacterium]|nr:M28 family peptidase [Candidatus Hydrogenedentota bacterium]
MAQNQIHDDLMYLAGRLLHRGAQTDAERSAAEFIRQRLSQSTPDVHLDEFSSFANYTFLFASYYSEFLVVSLLAVWWPLVAAAYGLFVFLCYLAEFLGYRVFARMLPQFESQNVVARFLGLRPRMTLLVTAHYDSGNANLLSQPWILPWLRPLHALLVFCMVVVIASSAVEGWSLVMQRQFEAAAHLRWTAAGLLATASLILFYVSSQGEDIRGAIGNASGVAALLQLAERLRTHPLEEADVWLVATGSHEAWMSGMRHLLVANKLEKKHCQILNLEGVGAGGLRYITAEGMLIATPAGSTLRRAAEAVAGEYGAAPALLRAVPTAAHVPLARGYRSMTIMGLDDEGLPPHWNQPSDRVTEVDEDSIARAAAFSDAILRRVVNAAP